MQAQHQSSSDLKAITWTYPDEQAARHLTTIRIVGTAIFDYRVRKTPDARVRLECLATMAQAQGDLTDVEALVVAQVLATDIRVVAADLQRPSLDELGVAEVPNA